MSKMDNIFENESKEQLGYLYEQILEGRESGLRPRCLDDYIRKVQSNYPLTFGESWRYTEQLFWEEIAKRYFSKE